MQRQTLAVPSAILAVVDASGSMDFDAGTGTRMDLLADAAGIGSLDHDDELALRVAAVDLRARQRFDRARGRREPFRPRLHQDAGDFRQTRLGRRAGVGPGGPAKI